MSCDSSWNHISHEEQVPVKKRKEDWGVRFLSSFFSSESIQCGAADISRLGLGDLYLPCMR